MLGGQKAGGISYGFADFSPGLVLGAAALASGAALVLLIRRAPALARREPVSVVAIAGTTAYAIALLSYSDNRSSTYLLGYVGLPTLLAAALWLGLLLRAHPDRAAPGRLGALAFSLAVAAIMVGAAWPRMHTDFSDTALAHVRRARRLALEALAPAADRPPGARGPGAARAATRPRAGP